MGLFTAVGSVCAAAGLAVGGFGMASGSSGAMAAQHEGMQHMAMHSSDAGKTSAARVITKRELAQITPQGMLPVIRGRVTAGARIKVNVTSVPAGRYKFVVVDETSRHNWHMFGPGGVNETTTVGGVDRWVWRSTLVQGTYDIVCDPHSSNMHKELTVT